VRSVGDVRSVTATILAPKETEQTFRDELEVMFERRHDLFFDTNSDPEVEVTFEDSRHDKRYYLLLVATTSTGIKLGPDWLYDRAVRPGKLEQIVPTMVKKVRRNREAIQDAITPSLFTRLSRH
jgi:RNA 3'-terminal phosphate cyclase (ATP)